MNTTKGKQMKYYKVSLLNNDNTIMETIVFGSDAIAADDLITMFRFNSTIVWEIK
jgi:hypothetical protein